MAFSQNVLQILKVDVAVALLILDYKTNTDKKLIGALQPRTC